jgi:YspA, cpYpsA-related SLOG family
MRIVVTGDNDWSCPDLAARILRRLVARYGRDIVIIHGNEPGVDASFDAAAKEMALNVEARVINRKNTGFPTVGQRNRELLLGGADMCIAVHNRVADPGRQGDPGRQVAQRSWFSRGFSGVPGPRRAVFTKSAGEPVFVIGPISSFFLGRTSAGVGFQVNIQPLGYPTGPVVRPQLPAAP